LIAIRCTSFRSSNDEPREIDAALRRPARGDFHRDRSTRTTSGSRAWAVAIANAASRVEQPSDRGAESSTTPD
jgi:hypothetical protein